MNKSIFPCPVDVQVLHALEFLVANRPRERSGKHVGAREDVTETELVDEAEREAEYGRDLITASYRLGNQRTVHDDVVGQGGRQLRGVALPHGIEVLIKGGNAHGDLLTM